MARRAKQSGRSSEPVATTLILPGEKVLVGSDGKGGLNETRVIQTKRSKSAMGIYRNKLKESQEKDGVDSRAWSIATKLADLDDADLHVTYFHLLHYLDVLGVEKRATSQEEMFAAGETGPAPDVKDSDEEADDTTTKRIGRAARQVAEAAGARLSGD